jgi:carbonic anhydrase
MNIIEKILLQNKSWAQDKVADDPTFFSTLAAGQNPDIFWIGCSDSRVPANEITRTASGEIFVHRNIANLYKTDDINATSGLQFAVEVLKVKHVIVCGHYGCGGVKAALSDADFGLVSQWISPIKEVYQNSRAEIDHIHDENGRTNKLVELNVVKQVQNLSKSDIIQNAWKNGTSPSLHGWVYGLDDGLLRNLIHINAATENEAGMQQTA